MPKRPRIDATDLTINETTYRWCVRTFALLQKRLGLRINVHHADDKIETGQIFLFNHFARFETIVPQYLIYQQTGAFCRTMAAHELFSLSPTFGKFLLSIGGVPNRLEGVLPFMAAEILRGRKVIVFPEGGMIKDRQVVDEDGNFRVYSSISRTHRKHHKGATALAVLLAIFKKRILSTEAEGNTARLERWAEALGMDSLDELLAAARTPTNIVPANITFYPVRTGSNILRRTADLVAKDLPEPLKEELVIEGNILLKDTDMDIRFGRPFRPSLTWHWWERRLLDWSFAHVDSLDRLFNLNEGAETRIARLAPMLVGRNSRRLRDRCAHEIYKLATVNILHLASRLMLELAGRGETRVACNDFHRMLYAAIKYAQAEPAVHLHRTLDDPESYEGLLSGQCPDLEQLIALARDNGLVEEDAGHYRFLPKLLDEHDFDRVRIDNPVQVYANEIAPVQAACRAIDRALKRSNRVDARTLASQRFGDERRAHAYCRRAYSQDRYAAINRQATATESGEPFLLLPKAPDSVGVVLVHDFCASPAELRELGEHLHRRGHPVIGVRLKGHGTSPWDLRERSWRDWLGSVEQGCEILSAFAPRLCLVGFSLGGCLALRLAANVPSALTGKLAGVVSVSAPVELRNRSLGLAQVLHRANQIARHAPMLDGLVPFRQHESEQPQIDYRHMPVRGLFEWGQAINEMKRGLPYVACPVAILQATHDPVVEPSSAQIIFDAIEAKGKELHWISADRHGIVQWNVGETTKTIEQFVASLSGGPDAVTVIKRGRSKRRAPVPVAAVRQPQDALGR
ncbi:MAG: alpha/beta fold hydrolase [Alphaproteobacteria bacterium]|nr:alpha/beta fold hydrolase [Alphaproteobacteria bacterium]